MELLVRHFRTKPAFSLVELLVVMSIIALLIGILIPSLAKVNQVATKTMCASNLRQIGIGIQVYLDEQGSKFPPARYMPSPFISLFPDDPSLPVTLRGTVNTQSKVYKCRGDDGYVYDRAGISYTFNASLAGRDLDESWFVRRLKLQASQIPVAYDCDGNTFVLEGGGEITVPPFHMLRNLLFADGHVGNFE